MKKLLTALRRLLHPPGWALLLTPTVFSAIYTFYAILTAACMLHRSKRMENEVKPVEQIRK